MPGESLLQSEEQAIEPSDDLTNMVIGQGDAIRQVRNMIRQVAQYPATSVLLQGESGTGKDVVAWAIHKMSSRSSFHFVPINCAALPDSLLETELFGVEAGAFTDAKVAREGYLLRAHRGTLFLDEIASMPLRLQAKLLRFLETFCFHPVGGTREIQVNLRVISAVNVDLQKEVTQKKFREDLFYRLNVFTIYLPPLRDRPEDIELLTQHFLRLSQREGHPPLSVSDEAMEQMKRYSWPGNVRELRSALQLAQIFCEKQIIRPKDLPATLRQGLTGASQRLRELQQQMHLPPEGIELPTFLRSIERIFIQEALERCKGNQVRAAALLGISRDQLRYRL